MSEVAKRNQIYDQKYADNEQLILSFRPTLLGEQHTIKKNGKMYQRDKGFFA